MIIAAIATFSAAMAALGFSSVSKSTDNGNGDMYYITAASGGGYSNTASGGGLYAASGGAYAAASSGGAFSNVVSASGGALTIVHEGELIYAAPSHVYYAVNIDTPERLQLNFVGDTVTLSTNLDIYPDRSITWTSTNPESIYVDAYGNATALSDGSAYIIATDDQGNLSCVTLTAVINQ